MPGDIIELRLPSCMVRQASIATFGIDSWTGPDGTFYTVTIRPTRGSLWRLTASVQRMSRPIPRSGSLARTVLQPVARKSTVHGARWPDSGPKAACGPGRTQQTGPVTSPRAASASRTDLTRPAEEASSTEPHREVRGHVQAALQGRPPDNPCSRPADRRGHWYCGMRWRRRTEWLVLGLRSPSTGGADPAIVCSGPACPARLSTWPSVVLTDQLVTGLLLCQIGDHVGLQLEDLVDQTSSTGAPRPSPGSPICP
jgi:hypothetical protein